MGRITRNSSVTRVAIGQDPTQRIDALAVEEPLEIRVGGQPLTVTMRTPGHDVELAAGFLFAESIITSPEQFASAIHCGGPGTEPATGATALSHDDESRGGNTYNVLDVRLGPGAPPFSTDMARNFYTTSACGVCGKASIDQVEATSQFDLTTDKSTISAVDLTALPDQLRSRQSAFDKTGGMHAAGLFDATTGELIVVREDVGRHNAVDKVVGWAALNREFPLAGTVLHVSGRASFELAQKAVMAGIPILAAVSAPSSLAVELAKDSGLTVVGFLRGDTMNIYSHPERILTPTANANR